MSLDPNETINSNPADGSISNESPISNEKSITNVTPISNEPISNVTQSSNEIPISNESPIQNQIPEPSGNLYSTEELNQNIQINNEQFPEITPNISYETIGHKPENISLPPQYENNRQPPFDFQPMNVGGADQYGNGNKKSNKVAIAIISVIAVIVILYILFSSFFSNPKAKMMKAMEKTRDSYVSIFDKTLNFDAIKENAKDKNLYSGYKLTLNKISGDLDSDVLDVINSYLSDLEISFDNTVNEKNKEENGTFSLKISDFDFTTNYFATNDLIGVSIPEFFDKTLTIDTKNFTSKFNDSEFREYFDLEKKEEDIRNNTFNDKHKNDNYTQKIEEDYLTIYNNMVVEDKGKVKKEIEGKSIRCKEYQATILSEDIRELFDDITEMSEVTDVDAEDQVDELLKNDIVFTVYVYKNKMVAFECSYETRIDGEKALVNLDFDFTKSKIIGTVEISNWSETVTMLIEKNISDTTSDLAITLNENGDLIGTASLSTQLDGDNISINGDISTKKEEIVTLKCEGSLSNVKKGKSYSINLDDIEFEIGDLITFYMSAEVNVDVDGTIVIPDSKDCTNLFDMSTEDIDEFITEIQMNGLENEALLDLFESIVSNSTLSSDMTYDDNDFDDINDIINDDNNDSSDSDLTTDDSTDSNIIIVKDYDDNEIKLFCSDKTAEIENNDYYSFVIMNDQNYYASFSLYKDYSVEEIFDNEFNYYIENYDAEVSDLKTCNGYNYKTISYISDEYTIIDGFAVIQKGDYIVTINISQSALNEDDSIDDAVQFVLNNITVMK